ncbi:hypothetical protein B0H11DRAFT_1900145 [Mycena galericulata]|nr:hypothetical protein B0H11DRAFT_1900145 [Mycena galericulata]
MILFQVTRFWYVEAPMGELSSLTCLFIRVSELLSVYWWPETNFCFGPRDISIAPLALARRMLDSGDIDADPERGPSDPLPKPTEAPEPLPPALLDATMLVNCNDGCIRRETDGGGLRLWHLQVCLLHDIEATTCTLDAEMPCRDQELFAAQVHPTGGGSAGAFPVAFRPGCPPLLPLRSVLDSHFRCYCAGSANALVKHLVSSTPLEYGGHARGLPKAASSAVEAGEQGLANETRIIILTVKEKRMFSLGFEPLPAGKIFTCGEAKNFVFDFALPKLYSNALVSTLNSRVRAVQANDQPQRNLLFAGSNGQTAVPRSVIFNKPHFPRMYVPYLSFSIFPFEENDHDIRALFAAYAACTPSISLRCRTHFIRSARKHL